MLLPVALAALESMNVNMIPAVALAMLCIFVSPKLLFDSTRRLIM
jgi:hypothetical protein